MTISGPYTCPPAGSYVAVSGLNAAAANTRSTMGVMPELPEVETLRRGLAATVLDKSIESVEVLWRPSFDAPRTAIDRLTGHRLSAIRRRGKALIMDLDDDMHLLLHPMMTGQLVVAEHGETVFAGGHPSRSMLGMMPNGTTRLILRLSEDTDVFFNDQRKFGWIRLLDTEGLGRDRFLARLGPEPLGDAFTVAGLRERLAAHPVATIKSVLLDQSTVAGLGNIYADESLHLARIDPRRPSGALSLADTQRLHAAIRSTLNSAVNDGGTSFADYINAFRGQGNYLASAGVFRRAGQSCAECGAMIERIQVAGRGTNLCPRCQPKAGSNPRSSNSGR
jgi:formamidopyrimidine-DNA glycosylase